MSRAGRGCPRTELIIRDKCNFTEGERKNNMLHERRAGERVGLDRGDYLPLPFLKCMVLEQRCSNKTLRNSQIYVTRNYALVYKLIKADNGVMDMARDAYKIRKVYLTCDYKIYPPKKTTTTIKQMS